MKIEVDQQSIDKLIGKRVVEFNKTIKSLEDKIKRRDKQVQKLKHEVEVLKGSLMSDDKEEIEAIAKVARHLVTMLQEAKWVEKYHDSGRDWTANEYY